MLLAILEYVCNSNPNPLEPAASSKGGKKGCEGVCRLSEKDSGEGVLCMTESHRGTQRIRLRGYTVLGMPGLKNLITYELTTKIGH